MPDISSLGYSNLNACTTSDGSNSSYLSNLTYKPTPTPLDGPSTGLMMFLSLLQYQAPYLSPQYSDAAAKAGQAAFIQSGGQQMQDKFIKVANDQGRDTMHSLGITDGEAGVVGFAAKTYKNKQLNVNGPKIFDVKTNLTATENSATIGLKWNFK